METKICNRCNKEKNIDQYYLKPYSKSGKCMGHCKDCHNMAAKQRRIKDGGKKNKKYRMNKYKEQKEQEPWVLLHHTAKRRASLRNLEYNIDAEYLKSIWTDTCPILGIKLESPVGEQGLGRGKSKAGAKQTSHTIDRIDSTKGYIKGNVCIVSFRANIMKSHGTLDEHRKIVAFMEHQEQSTS